MVYGVLLLCTVVLYSPHCLLCAIALAWQPALIVIGLLSSFTAVGPLVLSGALFRLMRWCGASSDAAVAACLLISHFVLQSAARALALHGCLQLQRLGWAKGWLLVRSRVPLVSLSIAVGAGFSCTSLLVGGGALLAEAWASRLAIPMSAAQMNASAAKLDYLLSSNANCAPLPRLVQAAFQQLFFTCGQVAWTVMLGQAYAAASPRALVESTEGLAEGLRRDEGQRAAAGPVTREEALSCARDNDGSAHTAAPDAARLRLVMARATHACLMQDDGMCLPHTEAPGKDEGRETPGPTHALKSLRRSSLVEARSEAQLEVLTSRNAVAGEGLAPPSRTFAGEGRQREELEEANRETLADADALAPKQLSSTQCSRTATAVQLRPASVSSLHSPVASGLVAESVLTHRQPAALLTGLAALGLHLLFVLLPLTALSSAASAETSRRSGCSAYIPLQCLVTLISVAWGLWIVHCERHPSAYVRLV
ncbi:hypothetical protein ABL78_4587 [Leptomonas seymouri]|uniref:Uncharacterized protein n=1 Tax=Leptomonas seymouri TaxID=5684 RepID=A0A0N1HY04_LEPSE|nr:hypothetical protein ABL78_4587 [Leptomonas seymouri]|eukprot:KPI86361.1 hypothetical protein ABL78_4587 [Leptomonas seymouri]